MNVWLTSLVIVVALYNVGKLVWAKQITEVVRSGLILTALGMAAWVLR